MILVLWISILNFTNELFRWQKRRKLADKKFCSQVHLQPTIHIQVFLAYFICKIAHQEKTSWAKCSFYVIHLNYVSDEPILFKFCSQVHLEATFQLFIAYFICKIAHQKKTSWAKCSFYVIYSNYVSNEPILFKFCSQVHLKATVHIHVFLAYLICKIAHQEKTS